MKKIMILMLFVFGMNTLTSCSDNEIATTEKEQNFATLKNNRIAMLSSNVDNGTSDGVTPEVAKLKAELLKITKRKYFTDKGLKVPSTLKIVLINVNYNIYWYSQYLDENNNRKLLFGTKYPNNRASVSRRGMIMNSHKKSSKTVYLNI